jgi:von Willebrand factor type A domain
VTNIVQPAFFDDPSGDAGTAPAAADDAGTGLVPALDAGASLAGSGDLTVLLVFDKSSSMLFDWGGVTRWQVANESLRAALDPVLDVLTIGAIRFPLEETCGVPEFNSGAQIPFTSGRNFVNVWQETEHRLESLGTPLGAALEVADRAIMQAEVEGRLAERFRVVLVTDGEPNCNEDPHQLASLVAGWYSHNVETVVIGLPGSEYAAALLDALAEAGGTGTFTATETARELAGALGEAVK